MLALENYRLFLVKRFERTLTNYMDTVRHFYFVAVSLVFPFDGKAMRVNINEY